MSPAGFHIGPSLNFYSYNEKFIFYDDKGIARDSQENNYKVTSIGLSFGPQLLIHRMVTIDIFINPGLGIFNASEGELSSANSDNFSGAGITLAFGIFCGFAFGK